MIPERRVILEDMTLLFHKGKREPFVFVHKGVSKKQDFLSLYRSFSDDVMAALLVNQNKEVAAMLADQNSPQGIEFYFYANNFFCFTESIRPLVTWVETMYWYFSPYQWAQIWVWYLRNSLLDLVPVAQGVDNFIHWIHPSPLDNSIGFSSTYQWLVIYPQGCTVQP